MKIAVLSDIHGNWVALRYALNDLKELGINKIIVLGDVVMKGPMPSHCIQMLKNDDLEILGWIKGNTELWLEDFTDDFVPSSKNESELFSYYKYAIKNLSSEQLTFLKELPLQCSLNIEGTSILCVHGTPQSIVEAVDSTVPEEEVRKAIKGVKEQIILSGHSHTTFIGKVDDKTLFNVGSIGNPLDGDNRISYGIMDFSNGEVNLENRRISYPVEDVIEIAVEKDFPFVDQYRDVIRSASF